MTSQDIGILFLTSFVAGVIVFAYRRWKELVERDDAQQRQIADLKCELEEMKKQAEPQS